MTHTRQRTRQINVPLTIVLGLILVLLVVYLLQQPERGTAAWEVYFSPRGGCTDAIVRELGEARRTVLVQAYILTSEPIADALMHAHRRGVKVEAILDRSNRSDRYSAADFLVNVGIPTYIDDNHSIAHNKLILIDGQTVITGSFNFTRSAEERNAENLLILRDKRLAAIYERNWEAHRAHSERYQARGRRGERLLELD
jgi:phosphatidylserine/phosphatidylglycerophosphate/cardiolipin synthase-like enzyme